MKPAFCFGLVLLSLVACAGPQRCSPGFRDEATRAVVTSSMRVVVRCDGEAVAFGSAVAVSPWYALTAAHVVSAACPPGKTLQLEAVTWNGATIPISAVAAPAGYDGDTAYVHAARGARFDAWATLTGVEPEVGDDLVMSTGHFVYADNLAASWTLKHGLMSGVVIYERHRYLVFSGHVVHGNSGAGVFDEGGRLVGVVSKADDDPDHENVGLVLPVEIPVPVGS